MKILKIMKNNVMTLKIHIIWQMIFKMEFNKYVIKNNMLKIDADKNILNNLDKLYWIVKLFKKQSNKLCQIILNILIIMLN